MKRLLIICVSLMCVGCSAVTCNEARSTATRELARKHYPLPKNYTVSVEEGTLHSDFCGSRDLWFVHFRAPTRHGSRDLYTVFISVRSGEIDQFIDMRYAVPSRQ